MKMENRKGSTLIITIIIFVVLMIFGTFILSFMVNENKMSLNHQRKIQAYYIARSGAEVVEAAIMDMSEVKKEELIDELEKDDIAIQEISIGKGKANIVLSQKKDSLIIESTGKIDKITETISKVIPIEGEENRTTSIDMAIFADSSMIFESNTQNNVRGDIGINSSSDKSIKFTSGFNDEITINIPIGADKEKVIDKPSWDTQRAKVNYINERTYSLSVFPEYPTNLPNKGRIITSWDNKNPIINTDAYYDSLVVESNRSITIDTSKGDIVLRVKDFDVEQGKIHVQGNGKVKLFIDNYKNLKGGFNIDGEPKNVEIYYNGDSIINIANETKIFGTFYVEKADINITGSGAINGNLISGGKNISVSGGSYVHNGAVYAPNADIKFLGSGNVKGGVVGKNVYLTGGASVEYDSNYANSIPIISTNTTITFKPSYYK